MKANCLSQVQMLSLVKPPEEPTPRARQTKGGFNYGKFGYILSSKLGRAEPLESDLFSWSFKKQD